MPNIGTLLSNYELQMQKNNIPIGHGNKRDEGTSVSEFERYIGVAKYPVFYQAGGYVI